MNREQYLKRLETCLDALSTEERSSALLYYVDYFEDAGADAEQEVIAQLGDPRQLADRILEENGQSPSAGRWRQWLAAAAQKCGAYRRRRSERRVSKSPHKRERLRIAVFCILFVLSAWLLLCGVAVVILSLTLISTGPMGALFYLGLGLFVSGGALLALSVLSGRLPRPRKRNTPPAGRQTAEEVTAHGR